MTPFFKESEPETQHFSQKASPFPEEDSSVQPNIFLVSSKWDRDHECLYAITLDSINCQSKAVHNGMGHAFILSRLAISHISAFCLSKP